MKRIIVLLLVLCLLSVTAFAEEYNWEEIAGALEGTGVSTELYTIEDAGVKLWVPEEMTAQEISDMDRETFFVAEFADADGAASLNVQYAEIPYADYLESVKETNGDDMVEMTVNGINALCVGIADMDSIFYVYEMPDDHVLILICAPMSEEGAAETWGIVASSVQLI